MTVLPAACEETELVVGAAPRGDSFQAQLWLCCLTLLVLTCSISGSSLWIDEGFSAYLACIRKFPDFLRVLLSSDSGDLQTGGYYLYLWFWVHLFGAGEWTLRAANLPFLGLLCFSFSFASHYRFQSSRLWPVCVVSPFIWFYSNEARNYLPLLACSSLAIAGHLVATSAAAARVRTVAVILFWLGLTAALFINLLATLTFPAWLLLLIFSRRWLPPIWRIVSLWASPIVLSELLYYVWTLLQRQDMRYESMRPAYILLWAYEFLGLQGLGPGRNQLRLLSPAAVFQNGGLQIAFFFGFVLCAVYVAAMLHASFAELDSVRRADASICPSKLASGKRWIGLERCTIPQLLLCGSASLLSVLILTFSLRERLLPRHGAAIYPFFLFTLLAILAVLERNATTRARRFLLQAALGCLVTIWLVSDLRLRCLERYDKEDYRAAAARVIQIAKQDRKTTIVWAADYMTAAYYGLQLKNPFAVPFGRMHLEQIFAMTGWSVLQTGVYGRDLTGSEVRVLAEDYSLPWIVALSKPDLYDVHQSWRARMTDTNELRPIQLGGFFIFSLPLPRQ